jgi:hypothetical protein
MPKSILGLTNSNPPRDPSPAVLRSISEAATWCFHRSDEGKSLRTAELNPHAILEMPRFPRDHSLYQEWAQKKRDNYRRAIAWINQTRSALLQNAGIASVDLGEALSKGKLLLYESPRRRSQTVRPKQSPMASSTSEMHLLGTHGSIWPVEASSVTSLSPPSGLLKKALTPIRSTASGGPPCPNWLAEKFDGLLTLGWRRFCAS